MARSRAAFVLRLVLALAAVLAAGAAALALFFYVTILADLPDLRSLRDYRPMLTTRVLDREGRPIGEFYEHRRRLVDLGDLAPHVVDAFLAAEDDTFFQHGGVDYVSIVRAAWANLRAGGEVRQGASTITQQMVKQLLLTPERSVKRKVREMVLARRIEQRFTKQEILYLYLNQIYFGSGAYGIGEAARTYFGKEIGDVTVGEAALLAGLPKAPSSNSPYVDPVRAEERRRYVLQRMREEGMIDEATWRDAVENPPVLASPPEHADYATCAYFDEEVRKALFERLGGETVLRGGLTIETTLNLDLQREAVSAVRGGLVALDRRQGWQGPTRHVSEGEIGAELARLADENGLADGTGTRAPPSGAAPPSGEPVPELPRDRRLVGVVVGVDAGANTARVAFAPGLEETLSIDAVRWAHPRDPDRYPYEMKRMTSVFHVGDVASFRLESALPAEGEKGESGEEAAAPPTPARLVLDQHPEVQGALLSLDVESGDVLALVGGYDFEESEFDRAVQAERQPGSAFKPLVYAAALGRGFTPTSIVHDRPVVYDDASGTTWRPQNYGRKFLGPLTLREALARSVNNATIHLMEQVGVDYVVRFARRLGIHSQLEPNLSLALGSYPVTLLELTRAYAVFAAGGRPVATRFVRRVLDRDGNVLLEDLALGGSAPEEPGEAAGEEPAARVAAGPDDLPGGDGGEAPEAEPPADGEHAEDPIAWGEDGRLIPATQAYLAASLLRGVVEHPKGTGRRARSLGRPVAGKTGTTNAQGDAWFLGFAPDLATGVWVGFDSKQVLGRGETGGHAALPIWLSFMEQALRDRPRRDFPVPEGIVFARVDPKTGLLADVDDPNAYFQPYLAGTEPDRSSAALTDSERRRRDRLDF